MPSLLRAIVAGAAALLLAGLVARDGMFTAAALQERSAAMLRIDPQSATAQSFAGEDAVARRDPAAAIWHATAALALAPMDPRALRVLAIARADRADGVGAGAALRLAGALGWRDTPTQFLILADAVERNDTTIAVQRADALARRGPERPVVFAIIRQIAARMPGGVDALVERLGRSPEWRPLFFQDNEPLKPADYGPREQLYAGIARGVAPPLPDEIAPYVAILIARQEFARARRSWLRWSGAGGDAALDLQDGGFTHIAMDGVGFGWQARPVVGAEVSIDSDGAAVDGDVLRADSDGSADGLMLSQLVTLSPGAHHFRIDAVLPDAASRDAFRWGLACADGGGELPVDLRIEGHVGRWTRLAAPFAVPPAKCRAQTLELRARGVDGARQISAFFDHAQID